MKLEFWGSPNATLPIGSRSTRELQPITFLVTNFVLMTSVRSMFFVCFLQLLASAAGAQEKDRTPRQYFMIGETKAENHQWEEALEALDACLARDPMFVDAYYSRAIAREHFNLLDDALTDYNIYMELRPEHREALFGRALLRFRLEQFQMAKLDFDRLLRMPAGATTTVFFQQDAFTGGVNRVFTTQGADQAYLFNYMGLTEDHLGNFAAAINWYDSAIAMQPGNPDLFVNRGISKVKSRDSTGAIDDYLRALRLDGNHALAKNNLAAIGGDKDQASGALLDQAIEDNPSMPYAFAERGYARMEKGELKGALSDYDEAIRIDPGNAEYLLNRGLVRERLRDLAGAYDDYTKAIAIKATFDKAWLGRGNVLSKQGRLEEAIEDYGVAILYNPGYASAYYNRAIARGRLHQNELACADLTTAESLGALVDLKARQKFCR